MNDDYFTKLDEQLSALTSEGAHLDRWARWRPLDQAARRTVAALGLVMLLATLLVIEFPGSASGSVHRATAQVAARTAHIARPAHIGQPAPTAQAPPRSLAGRQTAAPTVPLGRVA